MWQQMDGVLFLIPLGAIEIVTIFGHTSQVADAKIARTRRPVAVIGCGLSQIVETRPYKLSDGEWQVVHCHEVNLRQIAPRTPL